MLGSFPMLSSTAFAVLISWTLFQFFYLSTCHMISFNSPSCTTICLFSTLAMIPGVTAGSGQTPFPNIKFHVFSDFITSNFSSQVSLATVLLVLFSMLENPELLNLHARMKHPEQQGEHKVHASSWLTKFAYAFQQRLGDNIQDLFSEQLFPHTPIQRDLAIKLDSLAELLRLTPYRNGRLKSKLGSISRKGIEPIHMICPITMTCTTSTCRPRHLEQITKTANIPVVTLLKGTSCFENAYVLTGKCQHCKTLYVADHESYLLPNSRQRQEVYLNNASYIKIGQQLWVDRVFSKAVINATYSFHASASAFTQFWNDSYALEHVHGVLYRPPQTPIGLLQTL